jgi:hypothetical protein
VHLQVGGVGGAAREPFRAAFRGSAYRDDVAHQTFDDLAAGLAAPWRGLAFLARRPATWPLALVPAVVASLLLALLGWLFIHVTLGWIAAFLVGRDALHSAAR